MKAKRVFGIWKAIAFLTSVIFFSLSFASCCPEDEPVLIKAYISISKPENVTTNTATLIAWVKPNTDPTTVSFRYKEVIDNDWKSLLVGESYNGSSQIKVTYDINNLTVGTSYNLQAIATNAAGSDTSSVIIFATLEYSKATVNVITVRDLKINSAIIDFVAIPNQENTTITLEYQAENSDWQSKVMGLSFSGTDSVKLSCPLPNLLTNTKYKTRIKVNNKAGEVISDTVSFQTYELADYDGNLYRTVTIGSQTWLKENFRGTHYANGDPISNVTDTTTWKALTSGAYCYYNNDPKNGKIFGGLYNWYVGVDPRGLIIGWHTPTYEDFQQLRAFLYEGNDLSSAGRKMVDFTGNYWKFPQSNANNSSGFSALPNGSLGEGTYTHIYGFGSLGRGANFWGTDVFGNYADGASISSNYIFDNGNYGSKNDGFGIRLIKN
ncbi:MAG: FISUMP domain-containing protein [Paludibacter sp.]|nr:FISUMP domain-containing protein [Paludibacter sp.]